MTMTDTKSPTPDDDGTIDRTRWEPTTHQHETFKKREVEMCLAALQRDKTLTPVQTLFSAQTWETAQKVLQNTK